MIFVAALPPAEQHLQVDDSGGRAFSLALVTGVGRVALTKDCHAYTVVCWCTADQHPVEHQAVLGVVQDVVPLPDFGDNQADMDRLADQLVARTLVGSDLMAAVELGSLVE